MVPSHLGTLALWHLGTLALWMLLLSQPAAAQTVHLAVIAGLPGSAEHGELFQKWAATLVDAASQRFGVPSERIVYLADKAEVDPKRVTGRSTRQEIERAFAALAQAAAPEDIVFVLLIGHGTFDGKLAKFNLPGPDMGPADFAPLLKGLRSRHVVFVNAASASGPFVAGLAAPGRTIVTATRTGSERFATLFGGYFVDALTGDAADADKNRRISVLEAFEYARREVATAYEREGIMLTEHPLLDDNGDGEGSAQPGRDGKHGRVAAVMSLGAASSAEPLPADPRLRALHEQRRELERRVEALKLLKDSMDPARYAGELEKVLTELALKTREIKALEGKRP